MSSYTVLVRGVVPPDLAQRIAEAHAAALRDAQAKPRPRPADAQPHEQLDPAPESPGRP